MRRKRDYPARVTDLTPAPGELRILQAFVNTADLEHGTDEIASPRSLADWLASQGLAVGAELGVPDVERAAEAREALRDLLWAKTAGKATEEAVERLDRIASRSPVVVRFGVGATTRFEVGPGGLDGALGRLFAVVAAARLEGTWPRFKVCVNRRCRAAFFDSSRNLKGKWCSMRRCGNRIHSKQTQRRRRDRQRRVLQESRAAEQRRTREIDA